MTGRTHHVTQHKSALPGIEAMTLWTDRAFPRHAHDPLGIGVMTGGAQRSWNGIGAVESSAGDIITANPGHRGGPDHPGALRRWHRGAAPDCRAGWHVLLCVLQGNRLKACRTSMTRRSPPRRRSLRRPAHPGAAPTSSFRPAAPPCCVGWRAGPAWPAPDPAHCRAPPATVRIPSGRQGEGIAQSGGEPALQRRRRQPERHDDRPQRLQREHGANDVERHCPQPPPLALSKHAPVLFRRLMPAGTAQLAGCSRGPCAQSAAARVTAAIPSAPPAAPSRSP